MGLFDHLRGGPKKEAAPARDESVPQLITVYDKFGARFEVPREEWRTKVLPGNLRAAYDDADSLYQIIVMALNDGFFAELLDASERLLAIDANFERSHTVRAIVLSKSLQRKAAERVLTDYLQRHGTSGVVLTNLAKVYAEQGQTELSSATLWKAIQADPNQENGLLWWATLQKERGGEPAFWKAMTQAADLPKSWLPQLWLARRCLQDRKLTEALRYYEGVLSTAADGPEVLTMISGDLGNAGYLPEIIRLISPIFDPQRHDPRAGFNLLQAFLTLKDTVEGAKLLHRLFALERPDLKEALLQYEREFDNLKQLVPVPASTSDEPPPMAVWSVDLPIWYYGLQDPRWLLRSASDRHGEEVVFLSMSNVTHTDLKAPTAQRADDLGRLTRAIPLYLMESALFWTDLKPRAVMPFLQDVGPAVFGGEWPEESVFSAANGAKFAVSGFLQQSDAQLTLQLTVWDCSAKRRLKEFSKRTSVENVGAAILEFEKSVLDFLSQGKWLNTPRADFYRRPQPADAASYLVNLEQSLTLTSVRNALVSKEGLWGERAMMECLLWPAAQTPSPVARIQLLSALTTAKAFGSEIADEYRSKVLHLIENEKNRSSPFYRLSPVFLKTFGMDEEFRNRAAELSRDADSDYLQWLSALGSQP
jgi:tetratricopeptide (TPR) repeat protein